MALVLSIAVIILLLFVIAVYEEWIPTPPHTLAECHMGEENVDEEDISNCHKACQTEDEEFTDRLKESDEDRISDCHKACQTEDEEFTDRVKEKDEQDISDCHKACQTEDEEFTDRMKESDEQDISDCHKACQTEDKEFTECLKESDEESFDSDDSDDWQTVTEQAQCRVNKYHPLSAKEPFGLRQVSEERRELYESKNRKRPRNVIDLHGLRKHEALRVVYECLNHIENDRHYKHVDIITGRGKHSGYGIPRLKPAVRKFLKSRGTPYTLVEQNPGMLRVHLK